MPTGEERRQEGQLADAILDALTAAPALPPATAATAFLFKHWIRNHLPTSQIEELLSLATAVIGDQDRAMKWLSEPNLALDNRAPIHLVGERDGLERVTNLLLRIEYGALA